MKDGERERPIENYGKQEQKEWLDNMLHDPHPCTSGNKEEEHIYPFQKYISRHIIKYFTDNCSCFFLSIHLFVVNATLSKQNTYIGCSVFTNDI